MSIFDTLIVLIFLIFLCFFGFYQSKKNNNQKDFFLAGKNIGWITSMFSIVATETSVLTFISIPGIAYRGDWTFLQLSFGYIIGRFLVSIILIPIYFKNNIVSIYELLNRSFDPKIQKLASGTFLVTRVLADGVRFAAIAIVIQSVTGFSISSSIIIVGFITLIYTVLGGLKAVMKIDAFQFIIYLLSAVICIFYIVQYLDMSFFTILNNLNAENKFKIFDFSGNLFNSPLKFISAVIGGLMLSFSSHGVDYMMVQRVLATKDEFSAKKAMIGSGFFVMLQFSLFLFVGSILYLLPECQMISKDKEITYVIQNILPIGMKGIVVAGILSVAMSTLSSSINSLSSSTINDWFPKLKTLRNSRLISIFWTFVLILTALFFSNPNEPLLIVGLKIASFTYGSLLSLFLVAKLYKKISTNIILTGFLFGILVVFYFMKYDIPWTYYILGSVLTNLLIIFILQNLNHSLVNKFSFIALILSLIPLFYGEKEISSKTQIISLPVKNNCKLDSTLYGFDVMSIHDKQFDGILNIGLVANHTSSMIKINKDKKNIEINLGNNRLYVKKLFTPEHGLSNDYQAGEKIMGDMSYNIPIISLYGENFKPQLDDLSELDALFFDIQDIGSRYYTYVSTLTYVMEACAQIGLPLYVLDRPNPIGQNIDGPILDKKFSSFVGLHPIPISHGMTIGEIAFMINELGWINNNLDLNILKMEGWKREVYFESTGKKWIPPSPNIPDNETAFIYQGTCLIEGTNLSEGRGTDRPFSYIGAPWLNSKEVIDKISSMDFKGVEFNEVEFTPRFIPSKATYPKYKDEKCYGIEIRIVDREKVSPLKIIVSLIDVIYEMHPNEFKFKTNNFIDKLYGSDKLRNTIIFDLDLNILFEDWRRDKINFSKLRQPFLIY